MNEPTIRDLTDLDGKRVLVRADFCKSTGPMPVHIRLDFKPRESALKECFRRANRSPL